MIPSEKSQPEKEPKAEEPLAPEAAGEEIKSLDPEALRQALDEHKARAEEYLDQWKRARADFANLKRRTEKERAELLKFANAELLAKLLPVLDDFERALSNLPVELRAMTWLEGVFLIQRKLQLVLEQEGVQPLEVVGQPFDPNLHEAVIHEETNKHPDGQIIAEIQKGYKLGDRVLRPALVKVAKNHPETSQNES